MLFLLFQLGPERYALDAGRVVEVLPLVDFQPMPGAPEGVAGLFTYRGKLVPAVDLSRLIVGEPAPEKFTTRIILIEYADNDGRPRWLGLIAEKVTQVMRRDEADFYESGPRLNAAPYLGPMLLDEQGVVRRLHEDRLLPNTVRDAIFPGRT
jgi:chemotaxis-related protein WspB